MKRVLSVSYDPSLLRSREYLFHSIGLQVNSAYGFTVAMAACKDANFDLFVLGNSIPNEDKKALIATFRESCPAPVVEIYSPHEWPTGQADHAFDNGKNPSEFMDLVRKILELDRQNLAGSN